jgi:hypothetical protein
LLNANVKTNLTTHVLEDAHHILELLKILLGGGMPALGQQIEAAFAFMYPMGHIF